MTNTTFTTGRVYGCRSIGDHNCIFRFTVTRRTKRSVWLREEGESKVVRRSITVRDGIEQVMPLGSYSMAPVLTAEKDENGNR